MKTMTIKKSGGSKLSPGWKTLTISKAKYSDWEGNVCLDIWFEDLPETCNGRVYAATSKDSGEEFAIAQVFRFANAGLTSALTGADGNMVVEFDDTADNLVGKEINVFMYKDGEYSRILKQFAPTIFSNEVDNFTEDDVAYWKKRAIKYYNDYVNKDDHSNGFVASHPAKHKDGMESVTDDLPF